MAVAVNFSHERRLALIEIGVALVALFLGTLYGPLQALEQMGINLYWLVPWTQTYYQGLTLHGVLNALVWTAGAEVPGSAGVLSTDDLLAAESASADEMMPPMRGISIMVMPML